MVGQQNDVNVWLNKTGERNDEERNDKIASPKMGLFFIHKGIWTDKSREGERKGKKDVMSSNWAKKRKKKRRKEGRNAIELPNKVSIDLLTKRMMIYEKSGRNRDTTRHNQKAF